MAVPYGCLLLCCFCYFVLITIFFTFFRIFRVNEDDKSMPLRDEKTGFCVPADFGEVSLFCCFFVGFVVQCCPFNKIDAELAVNLSIVFGTFNSFGTGWIDRESGEQQVCGEPLRRLQRQRGERQKAAQECPQRRRLLLQLRRPALPHQRWLLLLVSLLFFCLVFCVFLLCTTFYTIHATTCKIMIHIILYCVFHSFLILTQV